MRTSSPVLLVAAFVLGACTTVAVQAVGASPEAEPAAGPAMAPSVDDDQPTPTVVSEAAAPRAQAPNGKGSITHLARGRNAYVGMLRMDPGGAVPTHRDATEEFIHVLEGGGTMTIDGQRYTVEPGTTIYMPAEAEVSFQAGEQPLLALQVFAGPAPAAKYDSWTPL